MQIKAINPETDSEFVADAKNINDDFITSMSHFEKTDGDIKRMIDNLDVSADIKSFLYTFSKTTIKAGEFILKIGRKVLDFICHLFKEYPSAGFGLIFGAIVGFLICSIPILGIILGSVATPIFMALGLVKGVNEDIKDKALKREIDQINARFSPLAV